jgi:putative transposase
MVVLNQEAYEKAKQSNEKSKFITGKDFDKYVNNELSKQEGFEWIKNCGSKARKATLENCNKAYIKFFKKEADYPSLKKKKNQDIKLYFPLNNPKDIVVKRHKIKIPTFGYVRLKEFGYIPTKQQPICVYVSQKADRYYVSVLFNNKLEIPKQSNNEGNAIDLGIKNYVTTCNKSYKNINKTNKVKKLERKRKRIQRSLSRKILQGKKTNTFSKNRQKNILQLQKQYVKIDRIRIDYENKIINEIVKTKPSYICLEDLNVSGMMKNQHLSKSILECRFYSFRSKMTRKCQLLGIEVRIANRFYPSSKLCRSCNYKNNDLKLKDRIFICPNCGLVIDRDLNAAINLLNCKDYTIPVACWESKVAISSTSVDCLDTVVGQSKSVTRRNRVKQKDKSVKIIVKSKS